MVLVARLRVWTQDQLPVIVETTAGQAHAGTGRPFPHEGLCRGSDLRMAQQQKNVCDTSHVSSASFPIGPTLAKFSNSGTDLKRNQTSIEKMLSSCLCRASRM